MPKPREPLDWHKLARSPHRIEFPANDSGLPHAWAPKRARAFAAAFEHIGAKVA